MSYWYEAGITDDEIITDEIITGDFRRFVGGKHILTLQQHRMKKEREDEVFKNDYSINFNDNDNDITDNDITDNDSLNNSSLDSLDNRMIDINSSLDSLKSKSDTDNDINNLNNDTDNDINDLINDTNNDINNSMVVIDNIDALIEAAFTEDNILITLLKKWYYSPTQLSIAELLRHCLSNCVVHSRDVVWVLQRYDPATNEYFSCTSSDDNDNNYVNYVWAMSPRMHELKLSVARLTETLMGRLQARAAACSYPLRELGTLRAKSMVLRDQRTLAFVLPIFLPMCRNDQFSGLIDANWGLVPFKNGVMVLDTLTFRPIRPDDYISRVLDYEYNPTPNLAPVIEYLNKIMPDPEKQKYLIQRGSCER